MHFPQLMQQSSAAWFTTAIACFGHAPTQGRAKHPDAAVRHLHMAVHAAVTADRTDRQHRFRVIVPGLRVSQILRQPAAIRPSPPLHAEPHQRHQPIFQHRPVLVDTAADRFLRPRPHLHRNSIDILFQVAAEKFLNETDHQLAARPLPHCSCHYLRADSRRAECRSLSRSSHCRRCGHR